MVTSLLYVQRLAIWLIVLVVPFSTGERLSAQGSISIGVDNTCAAPCFHSVIVLDEIVTSIDGSFTLDIGSAIQNPLCQLLLSSPPSQLTLSIEVLYPPNGFQISPVGAETLSFLVAQLPSGFVAALRRTRVVQPLAVGEFFLVIRSEVRLDNCPVSFVEKKIKVVVKDSLGMTASGAAIFKAALSFFGGGVGIGIVGTVTGLFKRIRQIFGWLLRLGNKSHNQKAGTGRNVNTRPRKESRPNSRR